ncbi:MAG: ATP-binding cassette domain-containing protein [Gaiellales bacterium]
MTESGAVHETIAGSGPAIEVVGVTKAFPGVLANDRIDLSVYAGEVHCVLGENGAGKSTLMNILSGMVQPDEGRILVHGVETQIDSPRRSLEVGIGMVYQHSTLIPTLSVLENLMIGPAAAAGDHQGALAGV